MCANCPDLGNGYFALKDLEAQAAAMREAMERFKWYIENSDGFWMGDKCGAWALDDNQSLEYQVMELLNSDAGRTLLERLRKAEASLESYKRWEKNIRQMNNVPDDMSLTDWASAVTERIGTLNTLLDKAEAERVEPYPKHGYCMGVNCTHWSLRKTLGTVDKNYCHNHCTAYHFHQYLRDHGMIREAE